MPATKKAPAKKRAVATTKAKKPAVAKKPAAKKAAPAASKAATPKLHHRIRKHVSRYFSVAAIALMLAIFLSQSATSSAIATPAVAPATPAQTQAAKDRAAATAAAAQAAKSGKGALLVYRVAGKTTYDSIKITAVGVTDLKKTNCGGSFTTKAQAVIKTLSVHPDNKTGEVKPIKISCTATTGAGAYYVYFGNKKVFTGAPSVAVGVDPGYCTMVHPDASLIRKVVMGTNGTCTGADVATIEKTTPTMRVLPDVTKSTTNKRITGTVELSVPGVDLSREICSGVVTLTYQQTTVAAGSTKVNPSLNKPFSVPLRFVKSGTANGYCTARLASTGSFSGTYTVLAEEKGTVYFNPVTASANITVPAPVVKAKPATTSHTNQ